MPLYAAPAGTYKWQQYTPPRLATRPIQGVGEMAPEIAARTAFGQQTSLKDPKTGKFVSPADPRVGIVSVTSKETVQHYRGVRILPMPTGGYVTDRKFPGDRRMGGGRSNRRQLWTPLYAQSVADMRRQIDQQLAPIEGLGAMTQTQNNLMWLGIGFGLGWIAGYVPGRS